MQNVRLTALFTRATTPLSHPQACRYFHGEFGIYQNILGTRKTIMYSVQLLDYQSHGMEKPSESDRRDTAYYASWAEGRERRWY